MRFAAIHQDNHEQLGIVKEGKVLILNQAWCDNHQLPWTMQDLVDQGFVGLERAESLKEELFANGSPAGQWVDESEVEYAPVVCKGRKIICVGLNYLRHVNESQLELPKSPLLFSKYDNTLAAHQQGVPKPLQTKQLDYEAEVAVVIGKEAKNVSEADAFDYVLGYTLANDLSARDLQFTTSQWLLGKSCDGFCPVGPALVTKDEVHNINDVVLRCYVNGELRQDGNTRDMIFPFATLISYISQHFTLEPGDVILSGTPEGVVLGMPPGQQAWLQAGDEVVVQAEQLGTLKTVIV